MYGEARRNIDIVKCTLMSSSLGYNLSNCMGKEILYHQPIR